MGRRFIRSATGTPAARAELPGPRVCDVHWAGERRTAVGAASMLLAALVIVDTIAGSFSASRAVLWTGLAALFFVILLPPRVSARPGLLTARGVLVEHSVRTDSLVSAQWSDGVAQRLILLDREGSRLEMDPGILIRNPALWYRLDADILVSFRRGTLRGEEMALREVVGRIDREAARTVFKVSGLD